MKLADFKNSLAALWALSVCGAGIAAGVGSLRGWAVLTALATFPPVVMLYRLNNPAQTMSESIQKARQ